MICWNDAGAEDGLQQLPAAQDRPAAAGADPQRLGVHPVRALQLGQALPQAGAAGGAYLIQSHELLEFLDFDTHTFGKQKASTKSQKAVFSEKNICNSGFAKVSMSRMRTPNPAVPC